ncbi:DUF1494 domain-containing protein [Chlamydiifrater phoenicopteri]|uniref:DUF1494 domain-containing protein n=1 Tax=Chlamydiifrater phoenicopteri TaxID=2681469 RepID=UPI001BCCD7F4|nr:DUF1494 domain-containing protein [Chlamydiifrater phoenicopteri]
MGGNPRRKSKRSFLLTEVVVCLSLMSILLGSIGFWQLLIAKKHERHKELYRVFGDESLAYKRLRAVFGSITEDFSLCSEGDSVCSFVFDRGVYKIPALSGNVRGRLVYDKEERVLSLIIQSQSSLDLEEESRLLDNVEAFVLTPIFDSSLLQKGSSGSKEGSSEMPSFIKINVSRGATKYTAARELAFTMVSGR